jgi:hypothetical protein
MLYRLIADSVLIVHFGFVLFVILGAVLCLRWRWAVWLHLPAVIWGIAVQLMGWRCPLTPLENHFRALGGQAGYSGGFVEHYLLSLLYPSGLTREIQIVLGLLVIAINLGVYLAIMTRLRRGTTDSHRSVAIARTRPSRGGGPARHEAGSSFLVPGELSDSSLIAAELMQ